MHNNIRVATLFFIISVPIILFQSCTDLASSSFEDSLAFIRSVEPIKGAQNANIDLRDGHSQDAMFLVDLSGINSNPFIINGKKPAWCIEWGKPVKRGEQKGVKLHSTRGQELWEDVNFFLSHMNQLQEEYPTLTWKEKQIVIWSLVKHKEFEIDEIPNYQGFSQNFYKDGEYLFDVELAKKVISHIKTNKQKQNNDSFAIILENEGQTVIIESGESVWAYGQYSFRSQNFREILGITAKGRGQWGWIFELIGDHASTELIAGGGNDDGTKAADEVGTTIGNLRITKNSNKLAVSYSLDSGYYIGDLHLWIGCSIENFPIINDTGNVAPGKMPYSYDGEPTGSYTFIIDLSNYNCSNNIFISAHAGKLYNVNENLFLDPTFELIDLSQYGLLGATDINDQGNIIGRNVYWNKDMEALVDMGIWGEAINNFESVTGSGPQVTSRKYPSYIWKPDNTLINLGSLSREFYDNEYIDAYDINNLGNVVGEVTGEHIQGYDQRNDPFFETFFEGFYWTSENGMKSITSDFGWANAINDHGKVVGVDVIVAEGWGFIWDKQNGLRILVQDTEFLDIIPESINNKDQVVGSMDVVQSKSLKVSKEKINSINRGKSIALLHSETGTRGVFHYRHVLEMLQNSTFQKQAIPQISRKNPLNTISNDQEVKKSLNKIKNSQIYKSSLNGAVKSVAFIYDERQGIKNLGSLGGDFSTAWDVNDQGQVVGYSSTASGDYRAFYWDKYNGMIELPTLGGNSIARAINNKGEIVGESYDSSGQNYPVMWKVKFKTQILAGE